MISVRRTKTQTAAFIFGAALIVIGILGFLPGAPWNFVAHGVEHHTLLLNVFLVSTIHNIVHIITGIAAIIAARKHFWAVRYFQVSAVVYSLVTIIGLVSGSFLGLFYINLSDHLLHLSIAIFSAVFGFADKKLTRSK